MSLSALQRPSGRVAAGIRCECAPRRPPVSKQPIDSRQDSVARRGAFGLSLLASGVLLLGSPAKAAEVLSGEARTVDGDTLVVSLAASQACMQHKQGLMLACSRSCGKRGVARRFVVRALMRLPLGSLHNIMQLSGEVVFESESR